jgi:hypothetical protein
VICVSTSRVILFKMPAADRVIYVQKLLDIVGSPANLVIQLTTYRSKWVPPEVFDTPGNIEGKLAWIVCVDLQKLPNETKAKFIPIREVKIIKAKKNKDHLMLWLELHNYLKCRDYEAFRKELEGSKKPIPPSEKGFILPDIEINSVDVIGSENLEQENSAWEEMVTVLGSMEVFRNAVFYRISSIFDKKHDLSQQNAMKNDAPFSYYQMIANKEYYLKGHYCLPDKQFEFCPQEIKISSENDWIKFYGDRKIIDRTGDLNICLKPLNVLDPHPYLDNISLIVSLESTKLLSPKIDLKILLKKESIKRKIRKNAGMIIWSATFISLFIAGEVLAAYYPPINGVSPTWEGISISTISSALLTFAIVTIPVALALWKRDE